MSLVVLLDHVARRLTDRRVETRVIGAAAMAAHGVSRATRDVDLLVAAHCVLEAEMWAGVPPPGFSVDVRRGDAADPLVGVVRFEEDLADDVDWEHVPSGVDLVVVRGRWVAGMTASPGPALAFGDTVLHAVTLIDLVLLKLYAGSARDAWDITALLDASDEREKLEADVERKLQGLPSQCEKLWTKISALRRG